MQPPPGVSATIECIMGVCECVMGKGLTYLKGVEGVMFNVWGLMCNGEGGETKVVKQF